jgi:hypothetical protein
MEYNIKTDLKYRGVWLEIGLIWLRKRYSGGLL